MRIYIYMSNQGASVLLTASLPEDFRGRFDKPFPACAFWSSHAPSPLFYVGISPQWLSELRWLDKGSLLSCLWARFPDGFPLYTWKVRTQWLDDVKLGWLCWMLLVVHVKDCQTIGNWKQVVEVRLLPFITICKYKAVHSFVRLCSTALVRLLPHSGKVTKMFLLWINFTQNQKQTKTK